jgi:hypothetical protein
LLVTSRLVVARLALWWRLLALAVLRTVLIDPNLRGRDQRRPWVRALAAVHPSVRLCALLLLLLLLHGLWMVRPSWAKDAECTALQLGALHLCGALMQQAAALAVAGAVGGVLWSTLRRASAEEAKDAELTEQPLAAACSSAAYYWEPEERLAELRQRGVESANWAVDTKLSTETVGVFTNWYTQAVWVAFRGSYSMSDWASNIRRVVPGDEERSPSFQASLAVARAAQRKYVLYKSLLLTGHSRGGNMADSFGRKLGLRSIGINPATWGKVFRSQEPAVESITARTADLISVLESFPSSERRVVFRWPEGASTALGACLGLAACRLLLSAVVRRGLLQPLPAAALSWALSLACVATIIGYITWMHSVLRFTMR